MRDESIRGRLRDLIADLDMRIATLTAERKAAERLLISLREVGVANDPAPRRNSAQRLMIEKEILDFLALGPAKAARLLLHLSLLRPTLNAATFRSYLHRLEERGLVSKSPTIRGTWEIVQHTR